MRACANGVIGMWRMQGAARGLLYKRWVRESCRGLGDVVRAGGYYCMLQKHTPDIEKNPSFVGNQA